MSQPFSRLPLPSADTGTAPNSMESHAPPEGHPAHEIASTIRFHFMAHLASLGLWPRSDAQASADAPKERIPAQHSAQRRDITADPEERASLLADLLRCVVQAEAEFAAVEARAGAEGEQRP